MVPGTPDWPIRGMELSRWVLANQRGIFMVRARGAALQKKAHNRWFQIADQFQLDGTALSGFLFTGENELQYKDLKAQCSGVKWMLTSSLQ